MSEMQFIPTLKRFLSENGSIYTVRRFPYRVTETYVEGVGRCKRTLICRIRSKDQLSNYVAQSGFDSVDEWWSVIRGFIPIGEDMWLFKVVMKR